MQYALIYSYDKCIFIFYNCNLHNTQYAEDNNNINRSCFNYTIRCNLYIICRIRTSFDQTWNSHFFFFSNLRTDDFFFARQIPKEFFQLLHYVQNYVFRMDGCSKYLEGDDTAHFVSVKRLCSVAKLVRTYVNNCVWETEKVFSIGSAVCRRRHFYATAK